MLPGPSRHQASADVMHSCDISQDPQPHPVFTCCSVGRGVAPKHGASAWSAVREQEDPVSQSPSTPTPATPDSEVCLPCPHQTSRCSPIAKAPSVFTTHPMAP